MYLVALFKNLSAHCENQNNSTNFELIWFCTPKIYILFMTKIQMKATLGIGDHLYQCQPTSSIITFNFFHSHFRFNKPSAAYSAHWSCVCTNCGKNLSFYRIHVFIIRIYQFQQLTRCFSGHLSIRHPSILFGQVLNNIK